VAKDSCSVLMPGNYELVTGDRRVVRTSYHSGNGLNPCRDIHCIIGRCSIRISVGTSAILSEVCCDFSQSILANARIMP
jgi:hypothetical protein